MLAQDLNDFPAPKNYLRNIFEEGFNFFGSDSDKNISEKEEEEFLLRLREKIPKDVFCKSKLKHYIIRYRNGKRPNFFFFETLEKILTVNEVISILFLSYKQLKIITGN